jgi:hypothetical protein
MSAMQERGREEWADYFANLPDLGNYREERLKLADEILLALAKARREAVEACAKVMCSRCKDKNIGIESLSYEGGSWIHRWGDGQWCRCGAQELHDFKEPKQ